MNPMNKVFGIIGAFGKAVLAIAVMVVAVIAADLVMAAFDRDRLCACHDHHLLSDHDEDNPGQQ